MPDASIRLTLPLPPSTNNLFVNVPGRGRVKSAVYAAWREEASLLIKLSRCGVLTGQYSVAIAVPEKDRADADSRIKAILDILVANGITPDDRQCWRVSAERDASVPKGECRVKIARA